MSIWAIDILKLLVSLIDRQLTNVFVVCLGITIDLLVVLIFDWPLSDAIIDYIRHLKQAVHFYFSCVAHSCFFDQCIPRTDGQ